MQGYISKPTAKTQFKSMQGHLGHFKPIKGVVSLDLLVYFPHCRQHGGQFLSCKVKASIFSSIMRLQLPWMLWHLTCLIYELWCSCLFGWCESCQSKSDVDHAIGLRPGFSWVPIRLWCSLFVMQLTSKKNHQQDSHWLCRFVIRESPLVRIKWTEI